MKRKERHQLKENELAGMIVAARDAVDTRRREVAGIILAAIVVAAVIAGISVWRQRSAARAEQLLAEAMVTFTAPVVPVTAAPSEPGGVPAAATIGATGSFATEAARLTAALPKLKAAADAYPDADAGITARYHYASSLAALGRYDEAIKEFEDVATRAGEGTLYGRMARLGKADTQVRAGQLETAIETWKALAAGTDDTLPKDAILMELGKAYQAAGNTEEARRAFNQIIDEHPASPYTAEARAALGS